MTDEHQPYLDSIPAYVLGALGPAETAELERHLETVCATCNAEMKRCTRDLEALAAANPPVTPSETTRARLLARVEQASKMRTQPVLPPPRRRVPWLPLAAAAMLALLVWSGWTQIDLRRKVDKLAAELSLDAAELARVRSDLDVARRRLDRWALASRILAAPGLETVRLAGLEAAPEASGQALVASADGKAVFSASNLAPPGPDKTYQLWLIVAGQPVSAGLLEVDEAGGASLVIESLDDPSAIEAWAVTLEPAGGVQQPTGPMVLLGATA
ncbi:MAG: anti-sigma factor [Acidobacteria bacterium]|nr:anti-sigma factor [Acidobacteriota bacterium]